MIYMHPRTANSFIVQIAMYFLSTLKHYVCGILFRIFFFNEKVCTPPHKQISMLSHMDLYTTYLYIFYYTIDQIYKPNSNFHILFVANKGSR